MNRNKFGLIALCFALVLLSAACADTATNKNTANGNLPGTNGNTSSNAANANTKANANANSNTSLTREDVSRKKDEYIAEAKKLGRKLGAGADDMWLWVKTREQLATADDLRDSTINVDVEKGVITLTGTVATAQQMKKAETIAKAIEGQKGVQNKLKISAEGANSNGNKNMKAGADKKKKD